MINSFLKITCRRSFAQSKRYLCTDNVVFKHNYDEKQAGHILKTINSENDLEKYEYAIYIS